MNTVEQIDELLKQRQGLNKTDPKTYRRISARIRYLRHPEAIRTKLREYREKHRGEIAYNAALRPLPPSARRTPTEEQKRKKNEATYRHDLTNPQRKSRRLIERALHGVYHRCSSKEPYAPGGRPHGKSEWLLGCSIKEFKQHIEAQLVKIGMKWHEWKDKWTMDHVIPVCRFDLPREQQACWHYTNLRPLPKHLNSRRGIRVTKRPEPAKRTYKKHAADWSGRTLRDAP